MKKTVILLTVLGLTCMLLTGCGQPTPLLSVTDYELDPETNTTKKGVAVGDTPETFLAAYGDYPIFTSVDGGDYQALPVEEIPFDASVACLLPTYLIDGLAVDPDAFCEENEIEKADLLDYLTDDRYLRAHTVVYYYLLFTWEDGVLTEIRSQFMDYNEDAAYYKDLS